MKYIIWVHHTDGDRYSAGTTTRLAEVEEMIETIRNKGLGAYVSRMPEGVIDTFIPLAKISLITWRTY